MEGVIPDNMKDGSFIVKGKGCKESLFSSSHGAGRVLSRKKAKELLDLKEFNNDMK
jgi:tRNA-splicing ligase RtcB